MTDYSDPSRWLICHYRPGSGGKFLCLALTTINKVAHWDRAVEKGQISFQDFVKTLWNPHRTDLWLANEPITDWDLTFFSRTMPRGDKLSIAQFNQLCAEQSSEYFRETWKSGKIILDFLNKGNVPVWWQKAKIVSLDAEITDIRYRQRLLEKLYHWDPITGIGSTMMDKPMPEQKYHNAIVYNNKWQHGPFETSDRWLDWVVQNDHRINFKIQSPDITMHDLLDYQKVKKLIKNIAEHLESDFQEKNLEFLYRYWFSKR